MYAHKNGIISLYKGARPEHPEVDHQALDSELTIKYVMVLISSRAMQE